MRLSWALLLVASLFLTACGDSPEEKADEINSRIGTMNSVIANLETDYDIDLAPFFSTQARVKSSLTEEELEDIERRLIRVDQLANEIFRLADDKNVMLLGRRNIENKQDNARLYLNIVRDRLDHAS